MSALDPTGQTDSTAALQSLFDAAGPDWAYVPPGAYLLSTAPAGFTLGGTSVPLHRAIRIRPGQRAYGPGVTIITRGCDDPSQQEVNYAFASDKYATQGALGDVQLVGFNFDFNPSRIPGGQRGENIRAMHLVGGRNVVLRDIGLYSSGARAGATITVQNARRLGVSRLSAHNITQAMNLRFVDGIDFADFDIGHTVEAIDVDSTTRFGTMRRLRFDNPFGRQGQALEIASGSCLRIGDLFVRGYDRPFTNLDKNTTNPNYVEYLAGVQPPSSQVVSEDIRVEGLHMEDCGPLAGGIAVQVSSNTGFAPRRVVFEDVTALRCGAIGGNPANLTIRRFDIRDSVPPAGTSYGAVFSHAVAGVAPCILLEDGVIDGSSGSGVTGNGVFGARRVSVDRYKGRGFHIQAHTGETFFEDTRVGGGGQGAATIYPAAGQPAAQFRGQNLYTGAGAPPPGWALAA